MYRCWVISIFYFCVKYYIIFQCFADTPSVEQFKVRKLKDQDGIQIAWLDNKIYVIQGGLDRVRIFADEAPFNELQDRIEMEGLGDSTRLVASVCSQLLVISDDTNKCFWKIQLPGNEVTRWDMDPPGSVLSMSITSDDELLVAIEHDPPHMDYIVTLKKEFEQAQQKDEFDDDENDERVENDDVNDKGEENDHENDGAENDDDDDDEDDDDDDNEDEEIGNVNKSSIPFPFPLDNESENSDSDSDRSDLSSGSELKLCFYRLEDGSRRKMYTFEQYTFEQYTFEQYTFEQ